GRQGVRRGTPHHAYLFANKSSTRMKVLVYDGFGIWLAARRLNKGRFIWTNGDQAIATAPQSRAIACAGDGAALADAHPRPRDHGRVIPPKP
ncbi:IS66 family insertion sequence element accessory protein TnpB, partial [Ralstonia pickettii]|uniref:IS66 family insertion sequence element accessory protein TnpB n=1 Tax=Ralstonia pickettii TaxID=329 RepID=UPI00191C5A3A